MRCLAQLYRCSCRIYDGLPELDCPSHDKAVIVTACGRICFNRRKVNLSMFFAGQTVGIEQPDEHIWLASFMEYNLGYFDETCRLDRSKPRSEQKCYLCVRYKLLPMCPEWTPIRMADRESI